MVSMHCGACSYWNSLHLSYGYFNWSILCVFIRNITVSDLTLNWISKCNVYLCMFLLLLWISEGHRSLNSVFNNNNETNLYAHLAFFLLLIWSMTNNWEIPVSHLITPIYLPCYISVDCSFSLLSSSNWLKNHSLKTKHIPIKTTNLNGVLIHIDKIYI